MSKKTQTQCPAGKHDADTEGVCEFAPNPTDHVGPHASPGYGITMDRDNYKLTPSVTGGTNYFHGTEDWLPVGELMAAKYNFPPDQYNYTIDTHHTVPYAVGELMKHCQPRMGMVTHFEYDRDTLSEFLAGVRYHWNGMFDIGAPDGITVNLTKDAIWYRDAAAPKYAGTAQPSPQWAQDWQGYYNSRVPADGADKDPYWLQWIG
ncbi:MAG: hypothetical protein QNK37_25025 [Acidobacteriota bacterium]|nr:hypothetical protein [Acidobacteriota bacterium]